MSTRDMESIISDAVIATEKEIAGDAWGDEEIAHDETGDRTLEAMGEGLEGQHEPDDDEEETEGEEPSEESEAEDGEGEGEEPKAETKPPAKAEGEAKPAPKTEAEPQGRVPSARLREANDRTRAVEAERDTLKAQLDAREAEFKKQIEGVNARFDALMTSLARPQPQQPAAEAKPATAPDLWEDPNGFFAHQTKPLADQITQLSNQIATQRVETSMAMAHGKHGDVFAKAFEAVNRLDPKNPDDRATVHRIYTSPNPGESLVAWHKRNETLRQVGDDPAAYTDRIRKEEREALMKDPEFRKQLVESLRAEAETGDDGRPRTQVRLPKSLNGAIGGNRRAVDPSEHDDSDQAVADSAWR